MPKRAALTLMFGAAAAAASCGELAGPGKAGELPDSLQVIAFPYSPQEAVAHFGRFRVETYTPPPAPTETADGVFTTIATSDAGHRVGKVAGRFAIWPAGATAPTYMFPVDTALSTLAASAINDRQEVLFSIHPKVSSTDLYVWRSSQLVRIYSQDISCPVVVRFTNRGRLGMMEQCTLHPNPLILKSPFDPDLSSSGRFAGQTCTGGITNILISIADDNDYLVSYGGSSAVPPTVGMNSSVGCADLGKKFGGLEVAWMTVGSGLAGGTHPTGSAFGVGVITDGSSLAAMSDLLDDAGRAAWRITDITRLNDDRTMLARGVRLSDGQVVTVRIVPAG